jgi:hypothetical protein
MFSHPPSGVYQKHFPGVWQYCVIKDVITRMSALPSAHIFVDNSNIFWGAQRAAAVHEPAAVYCAVRLYYRNFFSLIETGVDAKTRVLAGSVPPGNEELWNFARQGGYDTDLLHKVERDDGRLGEQGVDEMLHLKIANVLLDYEPPQVLVLATGDGKEGDFQTSFTRQIERALQRKWAVMIWSWQEQLSGRFQALIPSSNGLLSIRDLDRYYKSIVFIKGGSYRLPGGSATIQNRPASKLHLGVAGQ